jgi:hypothetical protein
LFVFRMAWAPDMTTSRMSGYGDCDVDRACAPILARATR